MLADIQTLDTALPKAERTAKGGDKEAKLRAEVIRKCLDHLGADQPLRKLTLDEIEAKAIESFGLMTAKPVLYVANVDESDLEGKGAAGPEGPRLRRQGRGLGRPGLRQARGRDRRARRGRPGRDARIVRPGRAALPVLAREAYRVLGLQSYFTAGEMEVRAWTIPVGATAPQAAGVIHTDFEKGFIRAEVYTPRGPGDVQDGEGHPRGRQAPGRGQGSTSWPTATSATSSSTEVRPDAPDRSSPCP